VGSTLGKPIENFEKIWARKIRSFKIYNYIGIRKMSLKEVFFQMALKRKISIFNGFREEK
jgi:hypothetical protein